MKIVWDEHYWLATQGWAYGTGETKWAAFWDCVHSALTYVWLRLRVDRWLLPAVWYDLFGWEAEVE